ncbi:MAG: hypothetical protein D3925_11505, partial [Candidatus Electrothrix sp. AR5]|nr:hypothetical protein [Candidatus Electrothrix sp. AR5]
APEKHVGMSRELTEQTIAFVEKRMQDRETPGGCRMLSLMHGAGRVYVRDCVISQDDGVLLPSDVVTAWSENEQAG